MAQIILDPFQAIIGAFKGPNYEDKEAYRQDQISYLQYCNRKWDKWIIDYFVTP